MSEKLAHWQNATKVPQEGQKVLGCWSGRTNNMMIVWYEDWTWHALIGGWQSVVMDEPPSHWMFLPEPPCAALETTPHG